MVFLTTFEAALPYNLFGGFKPFGFFILAPCGVGASGGSVFMVPRVFVLVCAVAVRSVCLCGLSCIGLLGAYVSAAATAAASSSAAVS